MEEKSFKQELKRILRLIDLEVEEAEKTKDKQELFGIGFYHGRTFAHRYDKILIEGLLKKIEGDDI